MSKPEEFLDTKEPSLDNKITLPVLATKNLLLRPPNIIDAPLMVEYFCKNKIRYSETSADVNVFEYNNIFFEKLIRRYLIEWKSGVSIRFLIFLQRDSSLIGDVSLTRIVMNPFYSCSIGYRICSEYEGFGYASEAVGSAIFFAFKMLKLKRVNAICSPGNSRSIKLLEGVGFKQDGFVGNCILINGLWRDQILYGIVNENHIL